MGLKDDFDRLESWWKELTRPLHWKDVLTLGLDRAYDAAGLICIGITSLCDVPGEMQRVEAFIHNCSILLPEVKAHWEEVWIHFTVTMQKLCNHVHVKLPEAFSDRDTENVIFMSRNENFCSVRELCLLTSQCGTGIICTKRLCQRAKRTGERFCARKYWQITQFHLRRPVHDYLELMEKIRKISAAQVTAPEQLSGATANVVH